MTSIPKAELLRVGAIVRDWICDNYEPGMNGHHTVELWPDAAWEMFRATLHLKYRGLFDAEFAEVKSRCVNLRKNGNTQFHMAHGHGAAPGTRNRGGRVCCPRCGIRFNLGSGEVAEGAK